MPTSVNAGRPAAAVAPKPAPAAPRSRFERRALVALCVLAAARVLFGALALPFFADTDEQAHFDLVRKFAAGHWPTDKYVRRDQETCKIAVYYHSPEFTARPDEFADGRYPPPVLERSPREQRDYVPVVYQRLWNEPNHEAHSPPVYYAVAGLWLDAGRSFFNQTGPREVYWTRCLNVPVFVALVAGAYFLCRPYFGGDVALGVAALTAFFPNTVFFTVNSDLLSPLTVLGTFLLLLRWYERERPGLWFSAAIGLLAAAAVLVKLTNAAVLVALGLVVLLRLWRDRQPGRLLREAGPLVVCGVLPILAWVVRNDIELHGDRTGTASKIEQLTWLPKPPGEWLNHPIFSAEVLVFLQKLTTNFFDGDSVFHGGPARSPTADTFLLATAAVLPPLGLWAAVWRGRGEPRARLAAGLAALLVVTFVGELVFLSMRFDFNRCDYPSRAFPFFTSGRLIAGGLVPFLTLYACGLAALTGRRPILFAAAVAVTVSMMVLAQEPYLKLAAASRYNWFHLPKTADARSVR